MRILDIPTDDRRVHTVPIPRLGGMAILAATVLVWVGKSIIDGALWEPFGQLPGDLTLGVAIGAGVVFAAGLMDDVRGLSPRVKLIAQIAAACFVVAYGLTPSAVAVTSGGTSWTVDPILATCVVVFWIVGITNAVNLIDGLDGLAGTFVLLAVILIIGTGLSLRSAIDPTGLLVIGGAVLGFLRYNWTPARIFMGDAGSMTLGFLLAVLSIVAATDAERVTHPAIPVLILSFPIADTGLAIARRWIRGIPFSVADDRHLHHQLRRIGFSVREVVGTLVAIFLSITVVGLLVVFAPPTLALAASIGGIIGLLVIFVYGVRWLEYEEFTEFGESLVSSVRHGRKLLQLTLRTNEAVTAIGRAPSEAALTEILDQLADAVGLVDIEIIKPGQRESTTPPSQQIIRLDAIPIRLDYAFTVPGVHGKQFLVRAWCVPTTADGPFVMERTLSRVAPAIARWHERSALEPDRRGRTQSAGTEVR